MSDESPRLSKTFDVFISHASKDKAEIRPLVDRMREAKVSVWFDEEQIKPGASWLQAIEEGLEESRYVLVFLSKNLRKSKWATLEYGSFVTEGRLIPVFLEPMADSEIPFVFRGIQRVERGRDLLEALLEHLRPLLIEQYFEVEAQRIFLHSSNFRHEQTEPAQLREIALWEVSFHDDDPHRLVRLAKPPLEFAELLARLAQGRERVWIVLGEAGVGKTTACGLLSSFLRRAEAGRGDDLIPVFLPLGSLGPTSEELTLELAVGDSRFPRLVKNLGRRLLLLLDGWNELPDSNVRRAQELMRVQLGQGATVVVTSRPVVAIDSIWRKSPISTYEILRWTDEQLASYFKRRGTEALLEAVPVEVRRCLRLPLLAYLVLSRLDVSRPSPDLRTVSDVFEHVVNRSLQLDRKSRLGSVPRLTAAEQRLAITDLAYSMTRDRTVQTTGRDLEEVLGRLPGDRRAELGPFLARLVDTGLVRCTNPRIALDPGTTAEQHRNLRFGFLHQAIQEYLTAQWLSAHPSEEFQLDVSHDAYWREVPIYMIQSLAGQRAKLEFARGILASHDYLTSSRLTRELRAPEGDDFRREVIDALLSNIERSGLYAYVIETFAELGDMGLEALRKRGLESSELGAVFAKAEAHVVGRPVEAAQELAWRRLGRSIYVLGEIGDLEMAKYLTPKLHSVLSVHLLYHVCEAYLTLARSSRTEAAERDLLSGGAQTLRQLPQSDPVIRAYAAAVLLECRREVDPAEDASRLRAFLEAQAAVGRGKERVFRDEFWRRAHGIEAFAELADLAESLEVANALFETEENADYRHHNDGYRQVQSSILKAVLRCCGRFPEDSKKWRPILEQVCRSSRVDENKWCRRHLERLLLLHFHGTADLSWIRELMESSAVPENIRTTLSNVVWLSE